MQCVAEALIAKEGKLQLSFPNIDLPTWDRILPKVTP